MTTDSARMHSVTAETSELVDLVLDYSRRRILATDTPLDKPLPESELRRLAGRTVSEGGMGAERALAVFEHVLAPACITTDHPRYLSFIPTAPTKAATAFDLVVSASAVYGGSWLEGSGCLPRRAASSCRAGPSATSPRSWPHATVPAPSAAILPAAGSSCVVQRRTPPWRPPHA